MCSDKMFVICYICSKVFMAGLPLLTQTWI